MSWIIDKLADFLRNIIIWLFFCVQKQILKYFDSISFEWNILNYLNKYDVKSFNQRISLYLKFLEIITNNEKDKKYKRAQILLDKYKKISLEFFLN